MAIYTLGAFFGAMSCIWLGDRLGRIRTIMIGAALNTVGAILQASSFSLGQLIVGRVVSGLGFGALSATAPNWQSECSKAEHRGSVVILESLFISLGLGRSLHSLMFGFWAPTDKFTCSSRFVDLFWCLLRQWLRNLAAALGTLGAVVDYCHSGHLSIARIT